MATPAPTKAPVPSKARTGRAERTRERLIEAAGAVFAARGYRGATMREIAQRSGANLAAAHYHVGSKEDLYREVAREYFERLETRLAAEEGAVAASDRSSHAALVDLLRARIHALLATLVDPDNVHTTLMLREMADPSEALPFMVRRWIDPMRRGTERILARLAPRLDAAAIESATRSVVGMVFFYRSHRAALLLMMRRADYPRGLVEDATDHIVAFTLGGLAELESRSAARPRRVRRAR